MITIPAATARRLNLQQGQPSQADSAGVVVTLYDTRLQSVSLGGFQQNNLRASIDPLMSEDYVLLGMNFLKHREITQYNKELLFSLPATSE